MTAPSGRIDRDSLRGRLILMLAALVTASVLAVGFAAVSAFNRAVEPELANRTRLIGTIIRAEFQRALELGIPIDAVAGLDRYLDAEDVHECEQDKRMDIAQQSIQASTVQLLELNSETKVHAANQTAHSDKPPKPTGG